MSKLTEALRTGDLTMEELKAGVRMEWEHMRNGEISGWTDADDDISVLISPVGTGYELVVEYKNRPIPGGRAKGRDVTSLQRRAQRMVEQELR